MESIGYAFVNWVKERRCMTCACGSYSPGLIVAYFNLWCALTKFPKAKEIKLSLKYQAAKVVLRNLSSVRREGQTGKRLRLQLFTDNLLHFVIHSCLLFEPFKSYKILKPVEFYFNSDYIDVYLCHDECDSFSDDSE